MTKENGIDKNFRQKFQELNYVMKQYLLFIPSSTDEQQKIADCLSSIDNLITAQSKKVEALKEHKKGLMQQLFPSKELN